MKRLASLTALIPSASLACSAENAMFHGKDPQRFMNGLLTVDVPGKSRVGAKKEGITCNFTPGIR